MNIQALLKSVVGDKEIILPEKSPVPPENRKMNVTDAIKQIRIQETSSLTFHKICFFT